MRIIIIPVSAAALYIEKIKSRRIDDQNKYPGKII